MEIRARLSREIEHGTTPAAISQADNAWSTPVGNLRRMRRIAHLTKSIDRNASVLEVGGGTGLQTEFLVKYFPKIVSIDISPDLLKVAKKRVPEATFYEMDAHCPKFENNSFDAILGVSILHHLDWELALKNYYQLLKPGGVIRFSEPNLFNPQIFLQKNIPYLKRLAGDSPDEYAFTRWNISRVLKRSGFSNISAIPFEFLHPSTPKYLVNVVIKIESALSRTPFREIGGSLLIEGNK